MSNRTTIAILLCLPCLSSACDQGVAPPAAPATAPVQPAKPVIAPVGTGQSKTVAPTPAATSDGTHAIKAIFRPDAVQYVEFKQDVSSLTVETSTPEIAASLMRLYGMLMHCDSVSPQGAELTFKLDRVAHAKRNTAGQKEFDSDNPAVLDDIGMTDTYKPLVGMELKFSLDDKNHVTAVKNVDLFAAKIAASRSGPIAIDASRDFSDERLSKIWVEYPLALFPDHPVKVGDTWTNSVIEIFPIGKVILPHQCKLEKVSRDGGHKTAVVSFRGVMQRVDKEFPVINGVKPTSYEFSFEGTAIYDFDVGQFTHRTQTNRTTYKFPGRPAKPGDLPPEQTVRVIAVQSYRVLSESERIAEKKRHLDEAAAQGGPSSSPAQNP